MAKTKSKPKKRLSWVNTENVRIDKATVVAVRAERENTGVPIGKFFELAAKEKFEREKN